MTMADEHKPESQTKRIYDRCNCCSSKIKWIKDDRTGKMFASEPGTGLRHKCRNGYSAKSNEREGYL